LRNQQLVAEPGDVFALTSLFGAARWVATTITGMDLTGANWRKSGKSGADEGCVEVAVNLPGIIAVRDGADPAGPVLVFTEDEWLVFTTAVRSGHYDETL
jgi:hypothetical protein